MHGQGYLLDSVAADNNSVRVVELGDQGYRGDTFSSWMQRWM